MGGLSAYTYITNTAERYRGSAVINEYGDEKFCKFTIVAENDLLKKKGLYCFIVDGKVKYIGRCTSTFNRRINSGYGNISPRNCFKGGQSTNCHINSKVNNAIGENKTVQIGLFIYDKDDIIKDMEKGLLERNALNLCWNVQKR